MHLYIHGFGSSARSYKARLLKQRASQRGLTCICPNLPVHPQLAFETLCDWVEQTQPKVVIGSSLGGFYARSLAARYDLPAVLINPALCPGERLREAIPRAIQYVDNTEFDWTLEHCQQLNAMAITHENQRRLWLLTQLGDEVLDAHQAIGLLPAAHQTVEADGDHSFIGFERYLDPVLDWRGPSTP